MATPATLSTVPAQTPYIQYVATSGQTVFPYPFEITQDSDLVVVANGTTLATDSGYTVSGVGNSTGGNLTFTSGRTVGDIITLYRDIPIERLTQFAQNGGFSSTAFNAEFNNVYLLLQQLQQNLDQCLQIPNTNNPAPTTSLAPGAYANKYLAFDANGNPEPAELTTSGSLTGSIIAGLLSVFTSAPIDPSRARTAAEIAAGVVPANYAYAPGDVRRYGADPTGVADSSTAFANAFLVKGLITAVGTFKIGTALVMDGATTSLIGPATINSTVASGQVITVQSSGGSESVAPNCIRGIKFVGTNIVGVRGIYFNSATNLIACLNIEDCTFTSFDKFVEFFSNAFEITFKGCVFSQGGAGGGCYTNTGGTNYGERISFVSCAFFNNTICLKSDYPSCQYFLSNCSLDYSNQMVVMNAGWAFLSNCYVESNLDTAYWFVANAGGASIFFDHGNISVTSTVQKAFEIGFSGANPGTLNITNSNLFATANTAKALIVAGTGNAFGRGNTVQGFSNIAGAWSNFSQAAQYCSNGTFTNGTGGLGGWTVGSANGGGNPTASANTLLLQVTTGGTEQHAYWTINAEAAQNVGFSCMVKGNVAGAQFDMVVRAIGADGVTIATQAGSPGFNQFNGTSFPMPTVYTNIRAVFPNLPAGTATVQLEFNTNGNTSNTNIVSVQSVYVGKY